MAKKKSTSVVRCTLDIGDRSVLCEFTQKGVKNINIRVCPDGSVSVSYPFGLSYQAVQNVLAEKAGFILRALENCDALSVPTKGELFYHGKPLEIRALYSKAVSACFCGDILELYLPTPEEFPTVDRLAKIRLLGQCRLELTRHCLNAYPKFDGIFPFPELHFKRMTSRWGSCAPQKNAVTLNTELISVPPECAEYVVFHEFTHFLQPNHSKSFYAELSSRLPDWKERKKLLDSCRVI